jgi:hypothetical protein
MTPLVRFLFIVSAEDSFESYLKYDKQNQQGKAAFNERNKHLTIVQLCFIMFYVDVFQNIKRVSIVKWH